MKHVTLISLLIVLAVAVSSQPINLEEVNDLTEIADTSAHIRVRRFTCDVLSVEAKGVKLNHAACGVHCLLRGRTGGYCNGKRVCVCR